MTLVPGIGSTLAATIEELVRTGRSSSLDRLRERLPPSASGGTTEGKIRAQIERRAARNHEEVLLHEATAEAEEILQKVRAQPTVERADVTGPLRRRTGDRDAHRGDRGGGRDPQAILDHARAPSPEGVDSEALRGSRRPPPHQRTDRAGRGRARRRPTWRPSIASPARRLTSPSSRRSRGSAASSWSHGPAQARPPSQRAERSGYLPASRPGIRRPGDARRRRRDRGRRRGHAARPSPRSRRHSRHGALPHDVLGRRALDRGDGARRRRPRHAVPDHHRPLPDRLVRRRPHRRPPAAAVGRDRARPGEASGCACCAGPSPTSWPTARSTTRTPSWSSSTS